MRKRLVLSHPQPKFPVAGTLKALVKVAICGMHTLSPHGLRSHKTMINKPQRVKVRPFPSTRRRVGLKGLVLGRGDVCISVDQGNIGIALDRTLQGNNPIKHTDIDFISQVRCFAGIAQHHINILGQVVIIVIYIGRQDFVIRVALDHARSKTGGNFSALRVLLAGQNGRIIGWGIG